VKTIKTKVYTFDELTDEAKETARDWYRNDLEFDTEFVFEAAANIAELFGLSIHKNYYSGFWSQGDGACFEGNYEYRKGALKAVKKHAPKDIVLHGIVQDLQDIQRRYFYQLTASTRHKGFYYHSGCMAVSVSGDPDIYYGNFTGPEDAVTQALREFADWIYQRLEAEWNYTTSDEAVDETIRCNEYEFTVGGKRY